MVRAWAQFHASVTILIVLVISTVGVLASVAAPKTRNDGREEKVIRFKDFIIPFCFIADTGGNWCTDTGTSFDSGLRVGGEPVVSPDGEWVASVTKQPMLPRHYILLTNLGDHTYQVPTYDTNSWYDPQDSDPSFSADGRTLAFASMRDAQIDEIFVVNIDRSGLRQLTKTKQGESHYPVFSPDGHTIAFTSNRHGRWRSPKFDLYLMNADGSNQRLLFSPPSCDAHKPTWSPDGNHVAFVACKTYVVEVTTGKTRALRSECYGPAWTPDPNVILCQGIYGLFALDVKQDVMLPFMFDDKKQLGGSHLFAFKPSILKRRHGLELQER